MSVLGVITGILRGSGEMEQFGGLGAVRPAATPTNQGCTYYVTDDATVPHGLYVSEANAWTRATDDYPVPASAGALLYPLGNNGAITTDKRLTWTPANGQLHVTAGTAAVPTVDLVSVDTQAQTVTVWDTNPTPNHARLVLSSTGTIVAQDATGLVTTTYGQNGLFTTNNGVNWFSYQSQQFTARDATGLERVRVDVVTGLVISTATPTVVRQWSIVNGLESIKHGVNSLTNTVTVASGSTSVDDANTLAAVGMKVLAAIQNATTNAVSIRSVVVTNGHVVVTLTGDPGAGGALVYYELRGTL